MPPRRPRALTFRQKMDAVVRVCSILLMTMMGAGAGFAMMGEWPRWLIPLARSAGLEKPIWPELDRVVAKLETTPEGATILSIEGEWIGGAKTGPTPAIEFDVRNSAGVTPIIPFTTSISVNAAGASVNATRNPDV